MRGMASFDVPEFDGLAWLKGAQVSGAKLLYNHRVRIMTGEYEGKFGWIVAIEPMKDAEPIYTVEVPDEDPNLELPESSLEPADITPCPRPGI